MSTEGNPGKEGQQQPVPSTKGGKHTSSWADGSVTEIIGTVVEDEMRGVMENLSSLVKLMNSGNSTAAAIPPPGFAELFADTFDKDTLTANTVTMENLQGPAVELNYEEWYDQFLYLMKVGYKTKLESIKPHMKGAFEWTVELTPPPPAEGCAATLPHVIFRSSALMQHGKIVRTVRQIAKEVEDDTVVHKRYAKKVIELAPPQTASKVAAAGKKRYGSWAFASVTGAIAAMGVDDVDPNEEDPMTRETIKNLTHLMSLHADESTPAATDDEIKRAFAAVFDKKVHALTRSKHGTGAEGALEELNYDQLLQRMLDTKHYQKEIVRIRPHVKGIVEYTVHMENAEMEETVRTVVFIQEGKVTHLERKETRYREKPKAPVIEPVSGQVKATDHVPIEGFSSEKELAKRVMPVSGKLLAGSGSGVKPCLTAGSVVKIFLERHKSLFQLKGQVDITDSEGKPYCDGVYFSEYKRRLITGKAFVLTAKNKEALAFCFQEPLLVDRRAFEIYSPRPLWPGDIAFEYENGEFCYPWFRFEDDIHHRSIRVWSGKGYMTMWRAFTHKSTGLLPTPKIESEKKHKHPANSNEIVIETASGDAELAYIKKIADGNKYEVTIAPGVDPAAVLSVAVIMEIMH